MNSGDSALRFENLQDISQKESSNLISLKNSIKERRKHLQVVKIKDSQIVNNKRNGIEFWNMSAYFSIKKSNISENKYSGILINQNRIQEPSYNNCDC